MSNPTDGAGTWPPRRQTNAAAALDFDDPLARQAPDDSDAGWGERPTDGGGGAADLARFLDEKPPHHI